MSIRMSTGAMSRMLSDASFQDVFANSVICLYSGTQPASADSEEIGTLLATVNIDGNTFTPGGGAGLNFGEAVDMTISKAAAETWLGNYVADGRMGWFRIYDNDQVTGESNSAARVDGSIGTSRADLIVTTTQSTIGGSISFDSFSFTFSTI